MVTEKIVVPVEIEGLFGVTDKVKIVEAILLAQAEFPIIHKADTAKIKTKSGSSFTYKFAPLPIVMETIQPIMTKYKLGVTHDTKTVGDFITVISVLMHESGEYKQTSITESVSANSESKNHVQAVGGLITFLKRYNIANLLNLVTDEDADGNNLGGNNSTPEKLPNNPGNTQPPKTDNSPPKSDVILDSSGTARYYPKEGRFNEAYQSAKGLISTAQWQEICKLAAVNIKSVKSKKDRVNILAKWIKTQYGYSFFDLTKENVNEVLDVLSNNSEKITEKK